ncbi:MAG: hypothetical protein PQJ60_10760 [Spirochaetales bacterium]|nr:hypothetical protein [Spirochaetales bacterium]
MQEEVKGENKQLEALLTELYEETVKVKWEEILRKREKAIALLSESKIGYREGFSLFKRLSHSQKEFNIIMAYARPILITNSEKYGN